jgi:class 3 adenylate cyclase
MTSGSDVVSPCPQCGGDNSGSARFCQHCGSRLEAPTAEQRKVVTVVFCDVTGSTALGERLDPEVLRRLMGRFYDRAREVVRRHEGSIEKFIGDAVVAVFGVPVSREDDALRAVRVAAEIQDAVRDLAVTVREEYGVELAVRTGVNTGEVVVGEARAGGSFATGDAVNTAARLE